MKDRKIVNIPIDNIVPSERPEQPWDSKESFRRWKDSLLNGHRQIFLKCLNCSLEFILLTLRSEIEILEAYHPSHGDNGGICANITCPECGKSKTSFILDIQKERGTICGFTNRK